MDRLNFTTTDSVNGSKPPSSTTTLSSSNKDGSDSPADSIESRKRDSPGYSRSHSRSVSIPAVIGSLTNTRSRHAEPGTSDIHPARSSLPTNSHTGGSIQLRSTRALLAQSRRQSTASNTSAEDGHLPKLDDNLDVPNAAAATSDDTYSFVAITESALASTARSSWSESYSRRLSGNSTYSLASARRIITSPPHSAADKGLAIRSTSTGLMSSTKSSGSGPSESGVSNITVTTSSNTQAIGAAGPQLTPRDPHSQPFDLMRRNQRAETMRSQPDRSRSRAKRRFSGSTANSSHSPSSERGPYYKEEGQNSILQKKEERRFY